MTQAAYESWLNVSGLYHILLQLLLFSIIWRIFYLPQPGGWKAALALLAVNCLLFFCTELPGGVRYAASFVFILAGCFIWRGKRLEKPVFLSLLFYNFHALSFLLANSVYQFAITGIMSGLQIQQIEDMDKMYERAFIGHILLVAAYTLFFCLMVYSLKKIVKQTFVMNWQETAFLSVLNIAGGMLTWMIVDLSMVQIDGGVFILYEDKQEMLWRVPAVAGLIYIGEMSAIYISQRYHELQKERQRHFIEAQKVKALRHRLEEAERFYGNIRKVRHDMKNHMANMKGLAAGGNYEALETYIEELDGSISALDYRFNTGNAVTDVIINDKYRRAEAAGIAFHVRFSYAPPEPVPVFDLGVILDNLLDNAIEACEKQKQGARYIRLSLKRREHFLLLEVENSFNGSLKPFDENGLPASGKTEEMPEHGIGLKNVKDMAERYLGGIQIHVMEKVFHITVMMQQPEFME